MDKGDRPREGDSRMIEDMVNSPSHYAAQGVECIDYIKQQLTEEQYMGYLLGNVTKYLHRHNYKNGLEDL